MKKLKNKIFGCFLFIIVFSIPFFVTPTKTLAAECKISSAVFSPAGVQPDEWYGDDFPPKVTITIITENCVGKEIEVRVVKHNRDRPDNDVNHITQKITLTTNRVVEHLRAGEGNCSATPGVFDCNYKIEVIVSGQLKFTSSENSHLLYECEVACLDDWEYVKTEQIEDVTKEEAKATADAEKKGEEVNNDGCILSHWFQGSLEGCVKEFVQTIVFGPISLLLWLVGQYWNFVVYQALGSGLYNAPFILNAWKVVRDFSNIFFILALLWIAIQIVLDMHAAEAKKMIAKVIISAMLINFSMFFTNIVIDSTNILALIFYNKIGVITKDSGGNLKAYESVSGKADEIDIAGAIINSFDPRKLADGEMIKKATNVFVNGQVVATGVILALPLAIGLISSAGLVMLIVEFVIIIIVLAWIHRIAELMFLIVFSPFAFMSFSIPGLKGLESFGWDSWLKRLLRAAFFAPIFMFMLYFIFILITSGLLKSLFATGLTAAPSDFIKSMLGIVFGLVFIMFLLWQTVKYAYKASGKAGELLVAGAKIAGTVALAVATEGASLAATSAIGGAASKTAGALRQKVASGGTLTSGEKTKLFVSEKLAKADIGGFVKSGVGGVAKMAGLGVDSRVPGFLGIQSTKGGYEGMKKEEIKKRQERARELQVNEEDPLKQKLNTTQENLQELNLEHADEIDSINKNIEKMRQEVADAASAVGASKGVKGQTEAQEDLDKATDTLKTAQAKPDEATVKVELDKATIDFNAVKGTAGETAAKIKLDGITEAFKAALEKPKEVAKAQADVLQANTQFSNLQGKIGEAGAQDALKKANEKLAKAKQIKKDMREGKAYEDFNATAPAPGQQPSMKAAIGSSGVNGVNLDALEKNQKVQAQAIKTENAKRNRAYANEQLSGVGNEPLFWLSPKVYTSAMAKEAKNKIIMETKLDSGAGDKH